MRRRRFLAAALAAVGTLVLAGHTPYRQWVVYRQAHLLIGCHRGDPRTYALAKEVVAGLTESLPEAKARVARAPHAQRLASLLGTAQLETAILTEADAVGMRAGEGRFAPYGAIDLAAIAPVQDRWLVARGDFPEDHGALVAEALVEAGLVAVGVPPDGPLPWHGGSRAVFEEHAPGHRHD